ncbi:MAG: F0F1 ATP synthase subunit delta [Gammaproteobacteria bacterium]
MELNWSTVVLEILNFLVLVWILKHFLYQPVLDVIARRRDGIEKTLADAGARHAQAVDLQKQYEGRLAEWSKEQQQAREALSQELAAERSRKLAELHTELEQEREKARVVWVRRQADAMRELEETALLQGTRFTTRLLQAAAGPELEARLVDIAIKGLTELPAERVSALRNSYGKPLEAIRVASAFPLADAQRQRLEQVLTGITGEELPQHFEQDSALLAGVRISIGAWVLGVNLQDELQGFMELAHAGG